MGPVIIFLGIILVIILGVVIYFFHTQCKRKTFAQQYIENCTSAIIAVDDKENTVIYNQTAEDLTGIPKEKVLGKPFVELVKKKFDSNDSILLNTLRTGRVYQHVESVMDTPSGPLHVMAHTDMLRDYRGRIVGSLLSIRDISDQKQLEAQIFQSEKFDLIGEVAAGIANEVRNPLTSMHGLLQLLENKMTKEDTNHTYIKIMLEEIQRLNVIISDFLLMFRPIVPIRWEADLHRILDEILLNTDKELQEKNITVTKKYLYSLPKVLVDVEQIKHVFLNIISNALHAMPDGGELAVSTGINYDSPSVTVTFTDTGCGIKPQAIDRIFEPFFTTWGDSTGLGLTVSKRIIHNHGGKIEVDSQPGRGSAFKVILPLNDD
ncbi:MAG: two-component system sensor histidine kinase NtrB [Bacillota bacterium]